jgi:hypothetical protein
MAVGLVTECQYGWIRKIMSYEGSKPSSKVVTWHFLGWIEKKPWKTSEYPVYRPKFESLFFFPERERFGFLTAVFLKILGLVGYYAVSMINFREVQNYDNVFKLSVQAVRQERPSVSQGITLEPSRSGDAQVESLIENSECVAVMIVWSYHIWAETVSPTCNYVLGVNLGQEQIFEEEDRTLPTDGFYVNYFVRYRRRRCYNSCRFTFHIRLYLTSELYVRYWKFLQRWTWRLFRDVTLYGTLCKYQRSQPLTSVWSEKSGIHRQKTTQACPKCCSLHSNVHGVVSQVTGILN